MTAPTIPQCLEPDIFRAEQRAQAAEEELARLRAELAKLQGNRS